MSKKTVSIAFEDYHKYEMICFECSRLGIKNKIFYDETEYQQHHIVQHQSTNNDKKTKLVCSECSKESASWYNFCAHITTHREHCQPPWICTISKKSKSKANGICGKSCSTRHNLIKHQEGFHRYNVVYKKKNPVIAKNINRNRANKPTVIAEPAPFKFVSKRKTDTNSVLLTRSPKVYINTRTKNPKRKLRPKMKCIENQNMIKTRKRSRANNPNSNNNNYNNKEPALKKQRVQRNINPNYINIESQVRFLNLLHKAAMHLNQDKKNGNGNGNGNGINMDYQPIYQINQINQINDTHQFPLNTALSPINSSISPSPDNIQRL